ncbi:MAG TPA: Wzz/FepE/Etk N-terminal domain-containing protein [Candidatus Acidoferrales bacterium]
MPEMTLRDILAPLFRHRRMVVISFFCVFGAAIVVAWAWAARYYVSNMQVVVEQDRSDPAITSAQVANVTNNKPITLDQVTSEVSLLQGDDMLRKVASTCGLADDKWSPFNVFLPSDPQRRMAARQEEAARNLAKKIKVETATTSDVIDVKYGRVGEPEVPACVLQTLGKLYLEKHLQLQRPAGSSDFFAQETEKYRQALAGSEAKLSDFSRTEGVAAPDILRTDMAGQLAVSQASLYQAQQAIAADEKRIDNIKEQLKVTPARSSTSEASMSANLLLENLGTQLLAAQVKRSQLLMKYDPNYPLVKEVDQEIAETQDAITNAEKAKYVNQTTDRDPTYELLREDQAKTEADLASEKATAGALANSIRGIRAQTVQLDQDAVKQAALVREAKADEGNYLLYLNKREQERTSDALDQKRIANVAIAVPAVVPILPAHSPWLIMFLGFFAAIVVAVAAAFVAEYLDPSFRTPEEVMNTLNMPVLATMPKKAA